MNEGDSRSRKLSSAVGDTIPESETLPRPPADCDDKFHREMDAEMMKDQSGRWSWFKVVELVIAKHGIGSIPRPLLQLPPPPCDHTDG
jgi:hypothetical protein